MEIPKESFNMAVATLMRLDGILKRMELVAMTTSGIMEQKLQIKLLRHFFSNASPLMKIVLKEEQYDNYKNKILGIKLRVRLVKGKYIEEYSPNLDNDILGLCTEIQGELKNYFMPPARRKMF